jgi:hypothetical protein
MVVDSIRSWPACVRRQGWRGRMTRIRHRRRGRMTRIRHPRQAGWRGGWRGWERADGSWFVRFRGDRMRAVGGCGWLGSGWGLRDGERGSDATCQVFPCRAVRLDEQRSAEKFAVLQAVMARKCGRSTGIWVLKNNNFIHEARLRSSPQSTCRFLEPIHARYCALSNHARRS